MNLPRQPPEQKKYSRPSCVCRCAVFAEFDRHPAYGIGNGAFADRAKGST